MDLKVAASVINEKPEKLKITDIDKILEEKSETYIYLDGSNAHKNIVKFIERFEKKGFSVIFKETKYDLNDDTIYEVHII